MAMELFGVSLSLLLLLVGAGLIVAEAFAPGAHFFVVGTALFVAGLVGVFLPPGLGLVTPLILAAVVLVVAGATLWAYRQFELTELPSQGRTSDSASLRGQTGRVVERVTETSGRVKLERGGFNPLYEARAVGADIPEDEEVLVIDPGGGNVLTVEAMSELEDEIDRELERGRVAEAAAEEADVEAEPDGDEAERS